VPDVARALDGKGGITLQVEVSAPQRDVVEAHQRTEAAEAAEITDFTRRNGAMEEHGVGKISNPIAKRQKATLRASPLIRSSA
jgi:hypothetical protein